MVQKKALLKTFAFPLVIITLLVAAIPFYPDIAKALQTREAFSAWIGQSGFPVELAFIGIQCVQVIVFIIPGELAQVAGGWMFGVLKGTLYSAIGITVGSIFNFFIARSLGPSFVHGIFGAKNLERWDGIMKSKRAAAGFFVLFAIPGIPKDILCYVAGLSSLRFPTFFAITMTARLPGIIGSSMMGSSAAKGDMTMALAIAGIAAALFFVGFFFQDAIKKYVLEKTHRGHSDKR